MFWLGFFIGTTTGLAFFTVMLALARKSRGEIKILEYWKENTLIAHKKIEVLQQIANALKNRIEG